MAKTQLTKNTTTGNWELTETNQGQTYTNTLNTDNKVVSGDIKISISAKSGTAGTPVATKGTVSGNKVVVTPKVTNVEGYISGGTISGTGVTVSASELVSGSKSITSNGTGIDVTNYASVDVAVPTGISPTGTITITQQTGTDVTQYATADVRAASNFSLVATDNTGTVSVGTLASGYYPLTNSITASLNAGTPGWFSSGSANDSSVQVGKMAAAVPSAAVSSLSSPTVALSGVVSGMATATTGSYYVTLSGSATNGSVKAKYTNSTAGYAPKNTTGTESTASAIAPNITGGKTIYIKAATTSKTEATASATITKVASASASITTTGFATTTTNTGYKIEASASGGSGIAKAEVSGSSCSVSEGYSDGISTSTSAKTATTTESTASDSKTVYIQKGALSAGVSGNITFTPSVSTNMATITKPSSGTEGTDYYSITGSGTKSGSVSGTASVATEGYVKTETASGGSASGSISADDKKYIKKCAITNNTSGGTSSGTINRGKQIKIDQGYNPSAVYYTAQSNSGTVTISSSGNTSCDGKTNVSVASGSAVVSAEKGTVSGNKVSVTPKVTKSAGWISTETVSGTAVEVSASELVSGTLTPTSSGTKDITNYASVNITAGTAGTPTATKGTVSGNKVTVTPKVTNSAGWISTGTITGTGVTVTASELVSGTYTVTGSGSANVTNYASISVASGSASQPDTTFNASSVSLEDDVVTLQANVTPSVSPGWVASGTSGTITIQGTITVPTFKKVTVTASSSQIYVVKGSVTIKAKNSAEGTGTTISDTYFKITSIATSSYQGGSYQTVVTYQTMKVYTSGSAPDWDSATTVAYGSLSSGGTCVLQFECGQGVVAKCSSTATSIAYYSDGSVTSGQYVYTMPYQIDAKRELCWYYLYVKCSSATNTRCLFYPYLGISYIQNYKPTASSARSTMTIRYRYSSNGSSYTSDSCSATASSSGQYTGSFDLYARYYPISEYL